MTIIAARISSTRVVMACDSAIVSSGGELTIDTASKITVHPDWGLVGEAGDCGALEACRAVFDVRTTVRGLAEGFAAAAKDRGEAWFLLVDPETRRLVVIGSTWEIIRRTGTFESLGSGGEVALGALACGASPGAAVAVACRFRSDCAGPVRVYRRKLPST